MLLGSVFKQQRQKLNLNQQEVSNGICTQAVISKLENQNISPSIDVLVQLCQKVQLTLNDLFSEFSNLPSTNLTTDKITETDLAIQKDDFAKADSLIRSIKQDSLSIIDLAHIHYQLGILSAEDDFDESIFQFNFVLQTLDNRKIDFWKFLAYVGLGNIYLIKHSRDKSKFYMQLALKVIPTSTISSDAEYYYYLKATRDLAKYLVEEKEWSLAEKLISNGLTPRNGYVSAKFTDELYYLSAFSKIKNESSDKSTVSHDLTMAIAFADFNHNQKLSDRINQLMQDSGIRELKIKP